MEILNNGHSTSSGDLVAGLMARAAELTGDRFRTAAAELNELLDSVIEKRMESSAPGVLGAGYDLVLFYGLTLKDRIDIADGMAIVPFDQVRAFVDKRIVEDLAPRRSVLDGWRSVGAVVRPFRWRPMFRRPGNLRDRTVRTLRYRAPERRESRPTCSAWPDLLSPHHTAHAAGPDSADSTSSTRARSCPGRLQTNQLGRRGRAERLLESRFSTPW